MAADPRNYALTYLNGADTLYLEVDLEGAATPARFEVAHYFASFACGEIPQAQCMLAVGRDTRSLLAGVEAEIHKYAGQLKQMLKARIYFEPKGDYNPLGDQWPPTGGQIIFEGYYTGFTYRKIQGKTQVVLNMIHWLFDLTGSSCLSKNSHPSNPFTLIAPAIMSSYNAISGGAGANQGSFLSTLLAHPILHQQVLSDLWSAVKDMFCAIASIETSPLGPSSECGTGTPAVRNDRALAALARMEGGTTAACKMAYTFGVPLKPDSRGMPVFDLAITNAICNAAISSYTNTTFWDKLVGEYCPMYNMTVVPTVDRALVIADTPALQAKWRTLEPDEYDSLDMNAYLERPLRAVGVYGNYGSMTGARQTNNPIDPINLGGCFSAKSVSDNDGIVQVVRAPGWLDNLISCVVNGTKTGNLKDIAITVATSPGLGVGEVVGTVGDLFAYSQKITQAGAYKLYSSYAQAVYVANMLRGRQGNLSGKLRFDIAPGSNLEIRSSVERHINEDDDELADTLYANVARVSVTINCESAMAGTAFQLTHVRTEQENAADRTSVKSHPLFGTSIHGNGLHGAPLVAAYNTVEE